MADRIVIDFTANVAEVTAGTDQIVQDLDTVQRALEEVEEGGKDLATELIENFLDSSRAADKSADEIERVLVNSYDLPADAARRMARISKDELADVEDAAGGVEDATSKIGDALGDVGGIAKDALEGDLAGAATSAVSSLAGLAGIAGGLAGTAVLGITELAKGVLGAVAAQQEEAEQRVADSVGKMIQAQAAAFTESQILDAVADLASNTTTLAQAQADAAATGLTVGEILRAQAGSSTELAAVLEITNAAYLAQSEAQDKVYESGGTVTTQMDQALSTASELKDRYYGVANGLNDAASGYNAYAEAAAIGAQNNDDFVESTTRLPGSISIPFEVPVPDVDEIFDGMQRKLSNRGPLKLVADVRDRNGQRVV